MYYKKLFSGEVWNHDFLKMLNRTPVQGKKDWIKKVLAALTQPTLSLGDEDKVVSFGYKARLRNLPFISALGSGYL
jgi:hypothetical protein